MSRRYRDFKKNIADVSFSEFRAINRLGQKWKRRGKRQFRNLISAVDDGKTMSQWADNHDDGKEFLARHDRVWMKVSRRYL